MITREDVRELAQFQCNKQESCALSFYFQPRTPQNKSHREEIILAKDLVRNALRESEKNGKNGCTREDLNRILDLAGKMHGNPARAKAIFACSAENMWREELARGIWEKLTVRCHHSNWPEFEPHLHPYVKQRLLGHFSADVATVNNDQIRDEASRMLRQALDDRRQTLLREALDQAKGNSLGVTGLRRVLRSLEVGEVQTLFLGEDFTARAVECTNCGHLDSHMVSYCALCGRATRELEDV